MENSREDHESARRIRAALREKIEPKIQGLIDKIDNAGIDLGRFALPSLPHVGERYPSAKTKVFVCGKGGGTWGLKGLNIEGWDEHSSLADVDFSTDWYGEQSRVDEEFMERVRRYLSGKPGGYSRGSWWRNTHRVTAAMVSYWPRLRFGAAGSSGEHRVQRASVSRNGSRGCYELDQEWLGNAENGEPKETRPTVKSAF